jgi:hypothetical protein
VARMMQAAGVVVSPTVPDLRALRHGAPTRPGGTARGARLALRDAHPHVDGQRGAPRPADGRGGGPQRSQAQRSFPPESSARPQRTRRDDPGGPSRSTPTVDARPERRRASSKAPAIPHRSRNDERSSPSRQRRKKQAARNRAVRKHDANGAR